MKQTEAGNIFKSNGVYNCLFQMKAVAPCVRMSSLSNGPLVCVCVCVSEWASERQIAEVLDKSSVKCNHVFTWANKQRACGSIENKKKKLTTISAW